jgi:hypothetical protein
LRRCHPPRIESAGAIGIYEQRVDFELPDFRVTGGEQAEPDRQFYDGLDVWSPWPRYTRDSRDTRVRAISLRASKEFSGGCSSERSCWILTEAPPWPNATRAPNTGSSTSPTRSSTAPGLKTIG